MCSLVKKLTEVWEKEGDVTFLKEDFASRGEVTKDFKFYEIEDPDLGAPNQPVEEEEVIPQPPGASGSDTLNEPTPMEQDQEEVKLRQSERGRIPRRRFEIESHERIPFLPSWLLYA